MDWFQLIGGEEEEEVGFVREEFDLPLRVKREKTREERLF